jgi:aryl-alcohol dehydrogenase-like predicted oxidoreductase
MRRLLPGTDLAISPLFLGGNVFGWTADEAASFAVLDAYVDAGGNAIDTADSYSAWAPGNVGGESETIIGRWLARRGRRDDVVVATKVAKHPDAHGLSPANLRRSVEGSLARLGTDHIDLYYAHEDDPATPMEETLAAFDALIGEGKVRHIAASNFTAGRLAQALAVSERDGLARYVALQPEYNLVERDAFEADLQPLCLREQVGVFPYFALASGFLTGKYRRGGVAVASERADGMDDLLDDRGVAILDALDRVAAAHAVRQGAVAIAWLAAQPAVVAPIASARTVEQLLELLPVLSLSLTASELELLDAASRGSLRG